MLVPGGHISFSGVKYCGMGEPETETSFLAMPSDNATACAQRTASFQSVKVTSRSIQGKAGASGISSAVMMPVVP